MTKMRTKTLLQPVEKLYFEVNPEELPDNSDPFALELSTVAELNRQVRNWLAQNCDCTWETKLERSDEGYPAVVVGVYFDLESRPEDLAAFKLRWL